MDDAAVAAFALGAIHRLIAGGEKPAQLGAVVGKDGEPDAGRAIERQPVDFDRLAQQPHASVRYRFAFDRAVSVVDEDRQFVAPKPAHEPIGLEFIIEAVRDRAEIPVADGMAEGIVDALETIEMGKKSGAVQFAGQRVGLRQSL